MLDQFTYWTLFVAGGERLIAVCASLHAVLRKRETQSVIGWVGLIWLSPFFGSLLYFCFGINRIERRGQRMQRGMDRTFRDALIRGRFVEDTAPQRLPFQGRLATVVGQLTGKPLLSGNALTLLRGGEEAYPAMLAEIAAAQESVSLCSYIFDNDRAGREFVDALAAARERGVEVRVLVDDVGSQYSKPRIIGELLRRGISAATFLPTFVPRLAVYANLRIHRKLMIVDGRVGFTGGMNIREGCRGDWETKHPIQDIHFRVEGPVVSHIQECFVTDWAFTTGEKLHGPLWFAPPERKGDMRARGVTDGPDTDLDNIRLVILAALSAAHEKVDIVTPYFLPDDSILNALNVTAMRGVRVRIVLPRRNNIKMVQWASADPILQVLSRGCEVYQTPPPFDHTKLLLVDGEWGLIGSSNWDPRSLRLNFEFNVEFYAPELCSQLEHLVDEKVDSAHRLTWTDMKARTFPLRLRDGLSRLAIPYL